MMTIQEETAQFLRYIEDGKQMFISNLPVEFAPYRREIWAAIETELFAYETRRTQRIVESVLRAGCLTTTDN
jgi:hypothetical protein